MGMPNQLSPFYFLRHGKTQANVDGLMCGGMWDIPLHQEGVIQAKDVAERLRRSAMVRPTAIYASPMVRTIQTAEIVASVFKLPVVTVDALREWDLGNWDRVPFETVKNDFLGVSDPLGGESRITFRARVLSALEVCAKNQGLPFLVSHGGVGLFIQQILKISPQRMENCAAYHFKHSAADGWEMLSLL